MATALGKRKLRTQKEGPSISPEEAQAKLAQFFEAQFKPLISTAKPPSPPDETGDEPASDSDGSGNDSWDGISEDDDESPTTSTVIEVVSHTEAYTTITNTLDKRESRAWLSSRPPISTDTSSTSKNKKVKATTAEEDAPSLLKNDLALQRLLSESHLFSSAAAKGGGDRDPGDATEHVGRNRHLATDLRLSALGSKRSIYKQEKMPMSFRKGIQAAAEGREAKRRREAKENGIVLERPGALGKKVAGKRKGPSRAIDAPAVGRMNGGMLRLGKRDIADIEGGGPRKGGTLTKKRRR
ncbi:hypothetical protein FHL15_007338 [Xylaria flabelliformis]|uniref:Protein FAF1 n=1 Tax=Xylaria flabelliformis TaxID=2512241 RepID=A0A553HV02_9PEZI|nr:hypothetical protein FHL15_007338 [Xylaria flabelliformis]